MKASMSSTFPDVTVYCAVKGCRTLHGVVWQVQGKQFYLNCLTK